MLEELNFKKIFKNRVNLVNNYLENVFKNEIIPSRLKESMLYSLNLGGKRIRPILCLSCAKLSNMDEELILPFAASIEMIHTYSLIHDDLPAMDNDDIRRGKASNHKAFDEATAILAGDGLLTEAFHFISNIKLPPKRILMAINVLAKASGASGMVGGQIIDILNTNKKTISFENLKQMHAMKTGALLHASCICGVILANGNKKLLNAIDIYGKALGLAFQIIDDILDETSDTKTLGKPAGSDKKNGKITYPSLFGLEKSKSLAKEQVEIAKKSINNFKNKEVHFLQKLAQYTLDRIA